MSSREISVLLTLAEQYICNHIVPITKKYNYSNELNINPGYQDIDSIQSPLLLNEKRIWVLRSDFILATGVKNAYKRRYGYTGFFDSFSPSVHQWIDANDRYGHPSLALAEGDYDGSVYYAGYICQREGFLQVYLSSGRFERDDLTEEQRAILEAYLACKFQRSYGMQEIIFDFSDSNDPQYHQAFFSGGYQGRGSLEGNPHRRFNKESAELRLASLCKPNPSNFEPLAEVSPT